jgi:hypothetical protein
MNLAALVPALMALTAPTLARPAQEGARAGQEVPEVTQSGKGARLARDQEALRGALEGLRRAGLDGVVRSSVAEVLARPDLAEWVPMSGWSVRRQALRFNQQWTTPKEAGENGPRALDFDSPDHPVHVIAAYAAALAQRGIDLIVVPVPKRIQVYPDRLPGVPEQGPEFRGIGMGHLQFLLALADRGVEVVDLLPAFAKDRRLEPVEFLGQRSDPLLFHDHNQHWTPRGAALAADLVAARILELDGVGPGDLEAGEDFHVRRARGTWDLSSRQSGPDAKPVDVWFDRVSDPAGGPFEKQDTSSPVLVLGDSFATYYAAESSDFLSLLCARISRRVDSVTSPGGGGVAVWKSLARRKSGLAGKRVVVWLFTTRVIADKSFAIVPF